MKKVNFTRVQVISFNTSQYKEKKQPYVFLSTYRNCEMKQLFISPKQECEFAYVNFFKYIPFALLSLLVQFQQRLILSKF